MIILGRIGDAELDRDLVEKAHVLFPGVCPAPAGGQTVALCGVVGTDLEAQAVAPTGERGILQQGLIATPVTIGAGTQHMLPATPASKPQQGEFHPGGGSPGSRIKYMGAQLGHRQISLHSGWPLIG